jgi:hypothetical protein
MKIQMKAKVNSMTLDIKTIIEITGVAGTLLVGGMKFGALDSRVNSLELRKDQTEDVATVKAQVNDLTVDMKELKNDVKQLLKR